MDPTRSATPKQRIREGQRRGTSSIGGGASDRHQSQQATPGRAKPAYGLLNCVTELHQPRYLPQRGGWGGVIPRHRGWAALSPSVEGGAAQENFRRPSEGAAGGNFPWPPNPASGSGPDFDFDFDLDLDLPPKVRVGPAPKVRVGS